MSVNTTKTKAGPYACDGANTDFIFPYKIFAETDLVVTLTDPEGEETVLDYGSDYSVSKAGVSWDNGAVVTTAAAYESGYTITIERVLGLLQLTDYRESDTFPAEIHENDHDKIMMIAQQIETKTQRAVQYPPSDPPGVKSILPSAALRASKFAAFDAEGSMIAAVGSNPSGVPVTEAAATILDDMTTGDMLTSLGASDYWKNKIQSANGAGLCGLYMIASSDSPDPWGNVSDYTCESGENLSGVIYNAVSNGRSMIMLAPGSYTWSTKLTLGVSDKLSIKGCGPSLTTITANAGTHTLIELPASFAGSIAVEDMSIDLSSINASSGAYYAFKGVSTDVGQHSWRNLRVNITSMITGTSEIRFFDYMKNMHNVKIHGTSMAFGTGSAQYPFYYCTDMFGCGVVFSSYTGTGNYQAFQSCDRLVECTAEIKTCPSSHNFYAFSSCSYLSACYALSDKSGSTGGVTGYLSCSYVTSCKAYYCKSIGFSTCEFVSACHASENGVGFSSCSWVTSCYAGRSTGDGFYNCNHVVACMSSQNGTYGLNACRQCQQNYATGNTSGQYTASYADQSANACANTATGGYNR